MKIIVLNGSPKGELSVTMQYVAYLARLYPQHEFNIHHIAQRLKRLENDSKAFEEVIDQIRSSDAVLWGFRCLFSMFMPTTNALSSLSSSATLRRHSKANIQPPYQLPSTSLTIPPIIIFMPSAMIWKCVFIQSLLAF